jgi:hypothetical protein
MNSSTAIWASVRPRATRGDQCLAIAIRTGQACRTRGGLTEDERRAMPLREAAARSASLDAEPRTGQLA